jgi:hypothetical protein
VDEDRLSPALGRLIDAAKGAARAAANEAAPADGATSDVVPGTDAAQRAEGWALLGPGGQAFAASDPAGALTAARAAGAGPADVEAVAFAVAGDPADSLLPSADPTAVLVGVDPDLPLAVKYLGRWVVVTLAEGGSLGKGGSR